MHGADAAGPPIPLGELVKLMLRMAVQAKDMFIYY
jgi:hypothetical protein